jgi:septum site-determining protein MinC
MAVVVKSGLPPAALFELKSASLSAVALVLKTPNLPALSAALSAQFGRSPGLFNHDPVVIDLAQLPPSQDFAFEPLIALLRSYKMLPVAVRGGSASLMQSAHAAGLSEVPMNPNEASAAPHKLASGAATVASAAAAPPSAPPAPPLNYVPTLVIHKPLRSGQQVYAKHGDLIVMAAVNFGAEVLADGNIHVYGPLRGKAVAGVKGNSEARIFTTCMEPELVSIAGTYRTTETPLPEDILGQPAQIWLKSGRLVFESLLNP